MSTAGTRLPSLLANGLDDLHAGLVRAEVIVGDEQSNAGILRGRIHRFRQIGGGDGVVSFNPKQHQRGLAHASIVFHQQHQGANRWRGQDCCIFGSVRLPFPRAPDLRAT